jgi:hypothetical protein
LSKPAIIMEMACTSHVCGSMMAQLWPDPATRPYLVQETASGFSAAHRDHFTAIAAANGGRLIGPVLAKRGVDPADVSEVALVGFSAGCWGVAEMLSDPDASSVSTVLCVDGLHYPTGAKFEPFAARAAAGEVMLVDLYSAIPVTGYTSTRDSARKLAGIVGAPAVSPLLSGADESFQSGHFYAIGFPGSDKQAHIDQVNRYQPLAWEAIVAPWLGSSPGARIDPGGGQGEPVKPPSAVVGPSAPPVVSPGSLVAFGLGVGALLLADMRWQLVDRILGRA